MRERCPTSCICERCQYNDVPDIGNMARALAVAVAGHVLRPEPDAYSLVDLGGDGGLGSPLSSFLAVELNTWITQMCISFITAYAAYKQVWKRFGVTDAA